MDSCLGVSVIVVTQSSQNHEIGLVIPFFFFFNLDTNPEPIPTLVIWDRGGTASLWHQLGTQPHLSPARVTLGTWPFTDEIWTLLDIRRNSSQKG